MQPKQMKDRGTSKNPGQPWTCKPRLEALPMRTAPAVWVFTTVAILQADKSSLSNKPLELLMRSVLSCNMRSLASPKGNSLPQASDVSNKL